jgi:hypothetical protein
MVEIGRVAVDGQRL